MVEGPKLIDGTALLNSIIFCESNANSILLIHTPPRYRQYSKFNAFLD